MSFFLEVISIDTLNETISHDIRTVQFYCADIDIRGAY